MDLMEGRPVPDFSLPSSDGGEVTLSGFKGNKNVVLYFYPKDDTPGCTTEACGFRDSLPRIERTDTVIFGVSADDGDSHRKFIVKYKLPFALLSDPNGAVAGTYGAWDGEKKRCKRVTVVIGKDGTLKKLFPQVRPEGHADEVLSAIGSSSGI